MNAARDAAGARAAQALAEAPYRMRCHEQPLRLVIRPGGKRTPACLAFVTAAMLVVVQSARADGAVGGAAPPLTDPGIISAWRTLRAADCARCHGKDYEGLAAPSIVDYARTESRETFARMVLDGNVARGMPAYRLNPPIADHLDDIHRYFMGRADGTIQADSRPQR
ncbi:cytochrome c55X [Paraburkholderia sp. GAS448]